MHPKKANPSDLNQVLVPHLALLSNQTTLAILLLIPIPLNRVTRLTEIKQMNILFFPEP